MAVAGAWLPAAGLPIAHVRQDSNRGLSIPVRGYQRDMTTSREEAEDLAVPQLDESVETLEGSGEEAAGYRGDDAAHRGDGPAPMVVESGWSDDGPDGGGPVTDPAESRDGEPPIAGDAPWGPGRESPMGEGSDNTAAPEVDPAERRLGG